MVHGAQVYILYTAKPEGISEGCEQQDRGNADGHVIGGLSSPAQSQIDREVRPGPSSRVGPR